MHDELGGTCILAAASLILSTLASESPFTLLRLRFDTMLMPYTPCRLQQTHMQTLMVQRPATFSF